ncbi:rod shape-determining protein RodA [Candidatus Gottesmanbacteria bacterium]|nr:rod shape-determining protein RodA [Candidatus Gottesmanbacteria bacterium]
MGRTTFLTTIVEELRSHVVDIFLLLCLASFGLFLLLSINSGLFIQQLLYLVGAFIVMILVSLFDTSLLLWLAPFAYGAGIVLLLAAYIGPVIRGARRWILLGPTQLQTSELAKPLFLLAYAWLMARLPPKTFRNVVIHVLIFFIPFLLIFKQPDLGTSVVYAASWLAMMVAGGFPIRSLLFFVLVGGIFLPVLWGRLHDYQQARILTFLNPALDPKGAGYNAVQSMIAVGSGQLVGRGLGRGTQSHLRFLPEFHTDFIFATLVEELGLLGGVLLLIVYALILFRILAPLLRGIVDHIVPFVYSVGLCFMLLTQVFIHAGMNMGIIPITGITLPFVSYGGSSLLSIAISFGFLWVLQRLRTP